MTYVHLFSEWALCHVKYILIFKYYIFTKKTNNIDFLLCERKTISYIFYSSTSLK